MPDQEAVSSLQWLDWDAPKHIGACYTLRTGGHSEGKFSSFNLGEHVGDQALAVANNRARLSELIQQPNIHWLKQVHGTEVIDIDHSQNTIGDGATTSRVEQICTVMTADCLPVFFCDAQGRRVAIAHAGWRGLAQGVLQNTLKYFERPEEVCTYLGPAISQAAFEVGSEVREAFICHLAHHEACFVPGQQADKWQADIYGLARNILEYGGVKSIFGGQHCTYGEPAQFFSYRRDQQCGRMASLIWIKPR